MALVCYYKDMLGNVTTQKNGNSQLFFFTERTQLNAAYAQLLEKLRLITFAEIC